MCHHNNLTGRLLRKTENQFSDFYVQLAAHLLLEVYQETGNVFTRYLEGSQSIYY